MIVFTYLSHRRVLETLFNLIYQKYGDENSKLYLEINNSTYAATFAKQSKAKFPQMKFVNQVLRNPKIWAAALTDLNLPSDLILPDFPDDLIYGVNSERVHNPDINGVFVSDKSPHPVKYFWKTMADVQLMVYKEFDEILAEAGCDDNDTL